MKQSKNRRRLTIGLTGGIGSGKSMLLTYLKERHHAAVLQLDAVGKQLLQPGYSCYEPVLHLFGEEILLPDGTLDRGKIAQEMFADPQKKKDLEAVIHPAVKEETLRFLREQKGTPVCVLEAALLIEDHYEEICDEIWYVYASKRVRAERLREQRGYSDERIRSSFASQLTEKEFRRHADFVINNNEDPERAMRRIDRRLLT